MVARRFRGKFRQCCSSQKRKACIYQGRQLVLNVAPSLQLLCDARLSFSSPEIQKATALPFQRQREGRFCSRSSPSGMPDSTEAWLCDSFSSCTFLYGMVTVVEPELAVCFKTRVELHHVRHQGRCSQTSVPENRCAMAFYERPWFLWLQFAYILWLIVRPAALFRLPWCGVMHLVRRCRPAVPVDPAVSIYLLPGLKHTIPPSHYLQRGVLDFAERLRRERNGSIDRVTGPSSATAIRGFGRCIVVGQEDLENVACFFCCHMKKQGFVREYLHVAGIIKIVRLCDLDTALRIYFSTKFFCLRLTGEGRTNLIEYSPLQPGRHWIYSVIATLPLLLQAKNYQLASAIVTVVTYFLDLFSNSLNKLFEALWLWIVRLVKLSSNWLPFTYKVFHYYSLCNFDMAFMPGCIDDLRIKERQISDFLFLQNAFLPQNVVVVEEFVADTPDPKDITDKTVNTVVKLWCFDIRCKFERVDPDGFLTFTADIQGALLNKVSHTYKVPVRNYFLLLAFLRWIKENKVPGLVSEIEVGGLRDSMICLGITETLTAFLEPGIKIFKGKFNPAQPFLIGDTCRGPPVYKA